MRRPIATIEAPPDALSRQNPVAPPRPVPKGHPSSQSLLRRIPLALGRAALELLPLLAFAAAAHLVVASGLGGTRLTRLVLSWVINSYVACRAALILTHMMLSPDSRRLRLVVLSDPAADYASRWCRRLIVLCVSGFALAEIGLFFGLSMAAREALLKGFGLVGHIFLCIIVLQKREAIARRIRGGGEGRASAVRRRIAAVWHWIALFYIVALWIVWAVELPNGYVRLLRFFFLTILIAVAARLLRIVVAGAVDGGLRLSPQTAARFPGVDSRTRTYIAALRATLIGLIWLAAAFALLEAWGIGIASWLATAALGRQLASALITVSLTLLFGLGVWETANFALDRHLARLTEDAQYARSARLRTLLPMLRTLLLILLIIIIALTVLSEIGVNIGPLLAGAGIVGVAIGFGSQKLVQDLITGLFLLLENAMQVGDSVTVSGLTGTVEQLSLRTIRLRAPDGSVHIIPFSAVTSVTNTNRGLGNVPVSIDVDFQEDTDRVSAVLKEVVAGMREDADFKDRILGDLELWGVDKIGAASATIAGQIPCTDAGRWVVQREFNRRLKKRFQELGIAMAQPVQNVVLHRAALGAQEAFR